MKEAIDLIHTLSTVGFPTLITLILYASYKRWWVWGSEYTKMEADKDAQIAKAEQSANEWKQMTFSATGLAEGGMFIAKTRGVTNVPK